MRWKGFNSNVVKADVKPGFETASIIKSLISQHEKVAEKHQITLEFGAEAEAEEISSSNDALLKTLPFGAILLF
jgi:hypothetical protein